MVTKIPFTIVVCTCDAYQDTWKPLFTLFHKYWPMLSDLIVINSETLAFEYQDLNIISPQLYKGKEEAYNIPWSKRLKAILTTVVKTEIVLIYLDDFFLQSPVNVDKLNICLEKMVLDKNIANIQLFSCPLPYKQVKEYPWLVKRSKNAPYLFSLQAGLWRTDRLIKFLRDHESPWYFERWGSIRGRRYGDDFYGLNSEVVFNYDPTKHGMSQGKWRPETEILFKKEEIDLDVSIRGVLTDDEKPQINRRNWIKTLWWIFKSLCP